MARDPARRACRTRIVPEVETDQHWRLGGLNRLLDRLRHLFNWAIAQGCADATPFKRHGVFVATHV